MQICMRMTTSDTSWKWHCRKFVKEDLFKKVKFWDTVNYSAFSTAPNSVSGMFISRFTFDSGTETQKWWRTSVCPFLISMLSNCRNNVVKSIRKKHIGWKGCMNVCITNVYINTNTALSPLLQAFSKPTMEMTHGPQCMKKGHPYPSLIDNCARTVLSMRNSLTHMHLALQVKPCGMTVA